jgi:sarcosine oxidase
MRRADVIVIGLGAMGAATAYQLAQRGANVIGFDRYAPPHTFGSTHGESRVTRLACAEGAEYVPLAMRSHEIWRQVEQATGASLLDACGVLMMAPDADTGGLHGTPQWLRSTIELAKQFDIEHEVLDGSQVRERFSAFEVDDEYSAYYEPGGGYVRPEIAVAVQLELARHNGATLLYGTTVCSMRESGDGIVVETTAGAYSADRVVVSAGPWLADLLDDPLLRELFTVYRQTLHWFEVDAERSDVAQPGATPVYLWAFGPGATDFFYGFPAIDGAVKVASERYDQPATPGDVERDVASSEAADVYDRALKGRLRIATPKRLRSAVCLYTVTPDHGFAIDEHPSLAGVTIVSPCSGHGFKHSAAIGESVAQRLLDEASAVDLSSFSLERLT